MEEWAVGLGGKCGAGLALLAEDKERKSIKADATRRETRLHARRLQFAANYEALFRDDYGAGGGFPSYCSASIFAFAWEAIYAHTAQKVGGASGGLK